MQTNPGKDRKTLRAELFESIRTAVSREGLSIHKAAERFGVHRKTVRQALRSAVPPERKRAPAVRPRLGPYEETVRAWLRADADVPPKQRHTATRVWQRLVDEEGAEVSRSAVSVMVRADLGPAILAAHIPLEHLPGQEAEVDFGDVFVLVGGIPVRAKLFSMRLCHSGRAHHVVYPSESHECFRDGHDVPSPPLAGFPGPDQIRQPHPGGHQGAPGPGAYRESALCRLPVPLGLRIHQLHPRHRGCTREGRHRGGDQTTTPSLIRSHAAGGESRGDQPGSQRPSLPRRHHPSRRVPTTTVAEAFAAEKEHLGCLAAEGF